MKAKWKHYFILTLTIMISGLVFSCRPAPPQTIVKPFNIRDGRYDSEFPSKPVADDLKEIVRSVTMISSMSFYRIYGFPLEMALAEKDVNNPSFDMEKKAKYTAITQSPANGTATIIYSDQQSVLLLTCAHIINEPDTVIKHFADLHGNPTIFVQSVSVKLRQSLYVPSLPRNSKVEVLAMDEDIDLALLGVKLVEHTGIPAPHLDVTWGNSRELQWGTFVYVIGYPGGKKIISNALVSSPQPGEKFDFLLNTNLHRGISGGIVLALRDGPPNFELVGIVNALSAKERYLLRPDPSSPITELVRTRPYKGDIYVDSQVEQLSGTTYVIGIEKVKRFLLKNAQRVKEKGYYLPAIR